MNNVVTIRDFKSKLSYYLKNIGDGLVVTSRGEKIALVTTYKPDVTTLPLVTTLKQEVTEYCLACKKLGRRREAIEEVIIYENEQERWAWLCKEHLSKHCVNA